MLVLTRKVNERILCSNGMVIVVAKVSKNSVKLAIQAPPEVTILRQELTSTPRDPLAVAGDGKGPKVVARRRSGTAR